jgi:hypothetical protein
MATERERSQTKDAIRMRESRARLAAEEEQRREEEAASAQRLLAATKANQKQRTAKSLAKKKKEKEALTMGFINGPGSAAKFTSLQPPGASPNDGAASAAMFSPLQPRNHASFSDDIGTAMHIMAASQKDVSDYNLKLTMKLLSGQTEVNEYANQFQSRIVELVKLQNPGASDKSPSVSVPH